MARGSGSEEHDEGPLHPALKKLRKEAAARGATLATGGKGGLPPELVLQVMRRDGYKCKRCGGRENLSVHHKAHLENPSPAMRAFKRNHAKNDPAGIVTLCAESPDGEKGCHDDVHDEDRAKGKATG